MCLIIRSFFGLGFWVLKAGVFDVESTTTLSSLRWPNSLEYGKKTWKTWNSVNILQVLLYGPLFVYSTSSQLHGPSLLRTISNWPICTIPIKFPPIINRKTTVITSSFSLIFEGYLSLISLSNEYFFVYISPLARVLEVEPKENSLFDYFGT